MAKAKIATVWLDGCSGCHMSLLDNDEKIIDLAPLIDLVYSPLVDTKEFPEGVDVTLVEGAVGNEDNLKLIKIIRERSKIVVALGDCAVTGNVSAMRNQFSVESVLTRAYVENAPAKPQIPTEGVPKLLKQAVPVHEIVNVDVFVPGCPPSSSLIFFVISELLEGRIPDLDERARFG